MSLKVLKSDGQGGWNGGQPSWDFSHLKKKLNRHGAEEVEPDGQEDAGGNLYNSKGGLIPMAAVLKVNT